MPLPLLLLPSLLLTMMMSACSCCGVGVERLCCWLCQCCFHPVHEVQRLLGDVAWGMAHLQAACAVAAPA